MSEKKSILSKLLIIVVLNVQNCYGSKTEKTNALLAALLTNTSDGVRPGLDYDEPVYVNISFILVALNELNEVKGYMSTIGFFYVDWMDERMAWDPGDYEGISHISISSNKVWVPKLVVTNSVDRIITLHEIASEVLYESDGMAYWKPGNVMKTSCYIEIPAYPFDAHFCRIHIAPWGDSYETVLVTPDKAIVKDLYSENMEWALTDTYTGVGVFNPKDPLTVAFFGIQFKRKPIFLVINVLVPLVFMSILSAAVFLVSQESGERLSFSITVLLSFAVFLNVIGNHVPKTSSPMPYVCYYVLVVLIDSGVITISAIITQRLYNRPEHNPVPQWLLKCLLMSDGHHNRTTHEDEKDVHVDNDLNCNVEKMNTLVTWKDVVRRVDKILFVLFFLITVVVGVYFILSMVYKTPKGHEPEHSYPEPDYDFW